MTSIYIEESFESYVIRMNADTALTPWRPVPEPENQDVLPAVYRSIDLYIFDAKRSKRLISAKFNFVYVDGYSRCTPYGYESLDGCRAKTFEKLVTGKLSEQFLNVSGTMALALTPCAREALYG